MRNSIRIQRPGRIATHVFAAASLALAVADCTPAPPHSKVIPSGPAASLRGVTAYEILQSGAQDLDVVLQGPRAGRLRVHATAQATTQQLEGPTRWTLTTRPDSIELASEDGSRWSARRAGDHWSTSAPLSKVVDGEPGARLDVLATVLAVDVDLAVQGSAIVFGDRYEQCTLECSVAASCVVQGVDDACARRVVLCGGCLEQEP